MRKSIYSNLAERDRLLRVECWEKRLSIVEAAEICGVNIQSLWRWYRTNGFVASCDEGVTRKNGISASVGREIIQMREKGLSLQIIADLAGFRPETVSAYLHKRGIK